MSIDIEALFAEAKSLGMYEEAKTSKRTNRKYIIKVDDKIIAQSCTMRDAREFRKYYREQGKSIRIEEECERLPKAPTPTVRYAVKEIKGIQNFATPTLTPTKAKEKVDRERKEYRVKQNETLRVIKDPWRNKNSTLYKEYMKGVIRDGFIVTETINGNIFLNFYGQRNEVIAYLKNYKGDIADIKCSPFTKETQKEWGL